MLSNQAAAKRAPAERLRQSGFVKQVGLAQAHQHLVGFAQRQQAFAKEAGKRGK
jgi:hypothetical protein